MCVVHNSVGSALLVLTVDGHTRASMRGTGGSTVPTLFIMLYNAIKGLGQLGQTCYYEKTFSIANIRIGVVRHLLW